MTMNFARLVDMQCQRREHQPALITETDVWTYGRLAENVGAISALLVARGVKKGDRVGLLGYNSAEFVAAAFAIYRVGGICVPLNYRLKRDELKFLLQDAGAVGMLCDREFVAAVDGVSGGLDMRVRVQLDGPRAEAPGWMTFSEALTSFAGQSAPLADVSATDLLRIMYTSGTTSRPKGVMITHGMATLNALVQTSELELTSVDRALISSPLYHVAAWDAPGVSVLFNGGALVIMRKFDAPLALELIERHKVTGGIFVQAILHGLREAADGSRNVSSLRFIIFGAAAGKLYQEIREMLPSAHLVQAYGMTECCSAIAYMHKAFAVSKLGSAGIAVPFVEFNVVDESDRLVQPGTFGEIVLRGPKVTPGYWNAPEMTAEAMRGGWFHTGDVGMVDEDGFIYVTDRLKDMIRSGGENVASQEIERVIYEHPAVLEAAVIGVPHPRWQEVPEAYIVLKHGASLTEEELIGHCRQFLASFKTPKAVRFIDHLPRNPSGKVLKRVLREQAAGIAASGNAASDGAA